jgi:hypothetical protein
LPRYHPSKLVTQANGSPIAPRSPGARDRRCGGGLWLVG